MNAFPDDLAEKQRNPDLSGLPPTLRIGGMTWTVKSEPRKMAENANYGETHSNDLEILIDGELPLQRQQETLLHEVIHAATDLILLPKAKLSESTVRIVAACLFQVLKDNPELMSFFQET